MARNGDSQRHGEEASESLEAKTARTPVCYSSQKSSLSGLLARGYRSYHRSVIGRSRNSALGGLGTLKR